MKSTFCPRPLRVRQLPALLPILLFLAAYPQSQAPPASANPPTVPPQAASNVLRVTTRMVVVDVVAVDKKGQPVNDLEASDFSLREDGHEQPISTFNFHDPGTQNPGDP